MTLRRRLLLLVTSLVVPAVMASALVAWFDFGRERSRTEQTLLSNTRAVALLIDRELSATERKLRALATAPRVIRGDMEAFRKQIAGTLGEGEWIVVLEPSGQQVLNTLLPPGTPLPMHPVPDNVRRVVETRQALVSDLFFGPVSRRYTFSVEVPVLRDGVVVYDLAMGMLPTVFSRIMAAQRLPPNWVLSIFDRTGTIVARSHQPERYVGKPVVPALRARLINNSEGVVDTETLESIPVLAAFSRAPESGWGFVIGVPRDELDATIRASALTTLALGLGLMAMGLVLATIFGRRIANPIGSLVPAAAAVGRGVPVAVPRSGLAEVDRVAEALEAAAALLRRRLEERDVAEERLAHSHQQLELQVVARTRELRTVNDRLRKEIGERERAESELHQAHKMQAIGQLSGGVAHDFNNLLQGISGVLHVAESRVSDPAVADLVSAGLRAVQRGASLTQQLLAFSRRQQLAPRPVDINATLDGMRELLRRTLGGTIQVAMMPGAGLWSAIADPQQLELALLNLAINARDAMPKGGLLTFTTANCTAGGPGMPAGDYVRVAVRDTGTGMSTEVRNRAFEPFFTTKEVGKGTGLGLSMVYGLARQLGGDVTLDSAPGEGTMVSLYLPRADAEGEAAARGAAGALPAFPEPEPEPVSPRGGDIAVLVVDDDALVRGGLVATLGDLGYRVIQAGNGAAALEILRGGASVHFLLTDYAMPGMTGLETVQRARDLHPRLPAAIMTGFADTTAFAVPASIQVLCKPFQRADLQTAIERGLAAARRSGDYIAAVASRPG